MFPSQIQGCETWSKSQVRRKYDFPLVTYHLLMWKGENISIPNVHKGLSK